MNPAPYGRRVAALLLDLLIEVSIAASVSLLGLLLLIPESTRSIGVVILIASIIVWFGIGGWNRAFVQGRTGQSWGKRITRISLVSADSLSPIGFWLALLRNVLTLVFGTITGGLLLVLDCLWPAFDPFRRRLLDRLLGTVVLDNSGSTSTASNTTILRDQERQNGW